MQIKRHSADKHAFREADANYLDVRFLSHSHPLSPILTGSIANKIVSLRGKYSFFSRAVSGQLGNGDCV